MKQRIERLQQKLREQKVDALLVTDLVNIRYLTGFVGADSRDGYVVVTGKGTYIVTSKLYPQWLNGQMATWLNGLEINHENKLSDRLKEICSKEGIKTLGFEENNLTVAELKKLKKGLDSGHTSTALSTSARMTLKPTTNFVENLRMIKDEKEIAALRKAAHLTDQTFSYILGYLRNLSNPGDLTESQLAWEIEKFIREHGGQLAFPPIVAFDTNSANPHHSPSIRYTLYPKRLILLDFGACIDGYCADMTRMILVGKPTEKQRAMYETVLRSQTAALDLLESGERSGAKLDSAARVVFEKSNLAPYPHSLGHGLGLQIHEGFRLTHKKDFILKPTMAFTIEPGYYETGWGGMRIEDTVLLRDNTVEILTKSSKKIMSI